jgi:hypothetical protein
MGSHFKMPIYGISFQNANLGHPILKCPFMGCHKYAFFKFMYVHMYIFLILHILTHNNSQQICSKYKGPG